MLAITEWNTLIYTSIGLYIGWAYAYWITTFQVIGSSILIIYDDEKAGVWMIDFAKTVPVPEGINITHRKPWKLGNHEEGYLTGIDNLIKVNNILILNNLWMISI